jgi:glycerate-2-kinase
VIGSAATAVQAIAAAAGRRELVTRIASEPLTGDAAETARRVMEDSLGAGPGLDIHAGETTLEVDGTGAGGRCQHAALVAAAGIQGHDGVVFLAAGTDGRDGPTDAAGAIVDGRSAERAAEAGHTVEAHLADFDSHPWLAASGDLIVTGSTGTNVGDIWLAWNSV